MPILEETVTRFRTSDGSHFFDRTEAAVYETREALLKHVGPLFRGLEVSEDEILDEIQKNAVEIVKWLQPYAQALADLHPKGNGR